MPSLYDPLKNLKTLQKHSITVREFFELNRSRIKLTSANGLERSERLIVEKNLHRPGLALTGFIGLFTHQRVQVFGNTEIHYLTALPEDERLASLHHLLEYEMPCIVLTDGNTFEPMLMNLLTDYGVPVFISGYETARAMFFMSDFLDDQFAPHTAVHGAFVDVYGVGVLFIGRSGIGKSEIALDLIERGHRLVADDVVMVTQKGEGILLGAGTEMVKHFMEIRGLGLIDIRAMFGIRAIRFQKRVEIVVHLEEWNDKQDYERTGLDTQEIKILNVRVPHVRLPIYPGKNVTVITEVIALSYLLKHYGYDAANEFSRRLKEHLEKKAEGVMERRAIDYFEHDFE